MKKKFKDGEIQFRITQRPLNGKNYWLARVYFGLSKEASGWENMFYSRSLDVELQAG